MQTRVDQLVPYGYTDAAISTFHAFGDRLVREFALELGLPTDSAGPVAARGRHLPARAALRLRAGRVPAARRPDALPGRPGDAVQPLQGRGREPAGLPRLRRGPGGPGGREPEPAAPNDRPTSAADDALRRSRRRPAATASWLAPTRYQALLRGVRSDRLRRPGEPGAAAAARIAAARVELQRRYRYILVDEFQDTNRAQSELVELLAAPHGNVTVVGDDDQSIYKFRGAAISNILEFKRRHPTRPPDRAAAQLPLPRADPGRELPADPLQRSGPPRGSQRHRQAARRRARRERSGRFGTWPSPPAPRRPTGSPGRSPAGSPAGRSRATSRSSCGPTRTRIRSCAA